VVKVPEDFDFKVDGLLSELHGQGLMLKIMAMSLSRVPLTSQWNLWKGRSTLFAC